MFYLKGSYGPVLVRLAWHAAGTYDKATNSGGSDGATMRFAPESDHGANAGLAVARTLLEPIQAVCFLIWIIYYYLLFFLNFWIFFLRFFFKYFVISFILKYYFCFFYIFFL